MKAVILAAGKGLRMRDLTQDVPKALLKVGNTRLLDNILDSLPPAVDEVTIVVGYKGDMIKKEYGTHYGDKKITYVTQNELTGTAHAVLLTKHHFKDSRERFLIVYGDEYPNRKQVEECLSHEFSWLCRELSYPKVSAEPTVSPGGLITSVVEKPERPTTHFVVGGLMVVNAEIFSYEPEEHTNGEFYLTSMMNQFVREHEVHAVKGVKDMEFTSPEDLIKNAHTVSVVVPVYNEQETVRELHRRIVETLRKQSYPFEVIFVNDGSTDNTLAVASALHPLTIVTLQRNYGETPALDVGIQKAIGDIIVLLDADLQDDPSGIQVFLDKLSEGYDVVVGWRQKRNDHWSRVVFSKFANIIVRRALKLHIHDYGCGLKAYRSKFIKDFRLWGDAQVFLPAVAVQRGARICEVPISHHARPVGASKIKITNMIKGAFDLLGMTFFIRYFSNPLRFFGGWGSVSILLSIVAFGTSVILRFIDTPITETPLPLVGTLFAIMGVLLFMMGLLAEMLLRTHYAAIDRSPYLIRDIKENT